MTKISTEANNGQNSEELIDKNTNAETGESPCCWKPPYPEMHNQNCFEFLERAKSFTHLVVEGGLLEDPQELKKFERRIESAFVVNKHTRKICHTTNDSGKITGVPK